MLFVFVTDTCVQHDYHDIHCSCRVTVTRWDPLVEQELDTILDHMISPRLSVVFMLLIYLAFNEIETFETFSGL